MQIYEHTLLVAESFDFSIIELDLKQELVDRLSFMEHFGTFKLTGQLTRTAQHRDRLHLKALISHSHRIKRKASSGVVREGWERKRGKEKG